MSWSNVFNRTVGNKIVTKEEKARQAGYDQGYREGRAGAELTRPSGLHRDMQAVRQAELRGYIKALENTVLAINGMTPHTGRKQILAVIQGQLEAKRGDLAETEAQEVHDGS